MSASLVPTRKAIDGEEMMLHRPTYSNPHVGGTQAPKLLDRVRLHLLEGGYGMDAQARYVEWCRQFILFHGKRHPAEMGADEVGRFLASLAARKLSRNTKE